MKFKVIMPSSNGHDTTVLEGVELLAGWVDGIDFTRLDDGPNKGGGTLVAVEDVIVNTKQAFWDEINGIMEKHKLGDFPRDTVDVRVMRRMAGG